MTKLKGEGKAKFREGLRLERLDMIEEALQDGVKIDDALIAVIINKKSDIAKFLVEKGANVNRVGPRGSSILTLAIAQFNKADDKLKMTKLLAPRVQYINHQEADGSSALHMVTFLDNHSADIIQVLVDNGAYVNAVNNKGETPLYKAVQWDKTESVKALINNGAYVNVVGPDNNTILESAASKGNLEIIELLVKNGAELSSSYDPKTTPKTLGLNTSVVEFFKKEYPLLRKEYLETPRREFSQELKGLFNEEWLTKGILFDFYREGQPLISYIELIKPTEIAATATREDLMRGKLSVSNSPAADAAPAVAEPPSAPAPTANGLLNPADYKKVEVDKANKRISITGMGEYVDKAGKAFAASLADAGKSTLEQARSIGATARATGATAVAADDQDHPSSRRGSVDNRSGRF